MRPASPVHDGLTMAVRCVACGSSADGTCAGAPRPCVPESRPVLRHLATGTACEGSLCEECALEWMLRGGVRYIAEGRNDMESPARLPARSGVLLPHIRRYWPAIGRRILVDSHDLRLGIFYVPGESWWLHLPGVVIQLREGGRS